MKDKDNIIKIFLLTVIIIAILFFVLLVLFALRTMRISQETEINGKSYTSYIEEDLTNIENLELGFINSIVNICEYDGTKLKLEQVTKNNHLYFKKNIKNNKLSISETNAGALFNTLVTIYIPNSYIKNISINNAFGNINLNDIANSLYIKNNSGNLVLNNINNVLSISNVSGNINIVNINSDLVINNSTGNIVIDNMVGSIKADTISGNIVINNFLIKNDSKLDSITGDISILINDQSICFLETVNDNGVNKINKEKCNNEKPVLKITNVTGNIEIN